MLLLMTTAANNDNTTSMSLGYNKEVKHTLSSGIQHPMYRYWAGWSTVEHDGGETEPHTEAGRRLRSEKGSQFRRCCPLPRGI